MSIKFSFVYSYVLYAVLYLRVSVLAQSADEEVRQIGASLDQFALKFLAETSKQAGNSLNVALSPYTIWSLMVITSEGAQGNTATQLEKTLGLPPTQNRDSFRQSYKSLGKFLNKNDNSDVTLETTSSIFSSSRQQLDAKFRQIAETVYDVNVSPINFSQTKNAANIINNQISAATRGRISNFVKEDDLAQAQVFMASTLYFKGNWDMRFNQSATTTEPFYDEFGKQIGEVEMMYNSDAYPFTLLFDNTAIAVELPYRGKKMAMVVVLPRKNVLLRTVLDKLATTPFAEVIDSLDKAVEDFGDEPTVVQLPKFKIVSDFNLNYVLDQMGIKDIFSEERANLLGMFSRGMYISRVLQRAEIEVDEEGTVASSASGAAYQFKISPPRFTANKPFVYIIYEKETRGIIFAGKFCNPPNLK